MSTAASKTILIAHHNQAVRDRFAAALADARHSFVLADSAEGALREASNRGTPVSLALVDLGLAKDGVAFVRSLRETGDRPVPVLVFAGTVTSAADVRALLGVRIAGYVNEHAATPQILPALAPHLFPDSFNRRTSPRVALGVPVSYRSGPTIAGALTLDIGKGGLAIRTMSPLQPRTAVVIRFQLPGEPEEIEASGRVAWSDRKVGMGVQFERVEAAAQEAIDAFVDANRA